MFSQNRSRTIRRSIMELITGDEAMSALDLSRVLGIREKVVCEHLPHIDRSVSTQGKKLEIVPSACQSCGYIFKERRRFTRPGRCPVCKNSHIQAPLYRIR